MRVHVRVCVCVCMCVYVCVSVCACMCVYACAHVCMSVHEWICKQMHMHMCICMYMCMCELKYKHACIWSILYKSYRTITNWVNSTLPVSLTLLPLLNLNIILTFCNKDKNHLVHLYLPILESNQQTLTPRWPANHLDVADEGLHNPLFLLHPLEGQAL